MTLTLTLIIVYFDNSTTKSNNQCSTFRINTTSFNVERHGDHIKTYIICTAACFNLECDVSSEGKLLRVDAPPADGED